MLTNPHDAFRGQSRSLNTVPYDVLGMVHGATGPRNKFDDIFSRLDIMHQRDRRTDRQTDGRTPGDSKDRACA